jgi:hypothetical protein
LIPRKKLDLPEQVSGRPITNRGVHLQPFGHHGDWLDRASYWVDLLVSMGMSWVVLLTDGDSVRQSHHGLNPLKVLLDAGVIPIIREANQFPRPFVEHDTVRWTVDLYGQYGLKPFWIIRNEPFDTREWVDKQVPHVAWHTVMTIWAEAAQFIASNGGIVGFPDGPSYPFNPLESVRDWNCKWLYDEGLGFYAGHHYGKNRPRDYPYDAITRHGAPLAEDTYDRLLDDYAGDPKWKEEPIDRLNRRRQELKSANLTPLQDDTCWRGWERIANWSLESFGYVLPMAMTEGGWTPRDRAGSGPDTDIRAPLTTPRMVAKRSIQMYDTPSPFFALCPWLLADDDMGGGGWPFDAWHGWAYSGKYGSKKPVIAALQQTPPKETQPREEPLVIDVEGDTRDLAWVQEAYGVSYRRGPAGPRLIEIHEFEGPATLDVWAVDGDGLPVEGVAFCYYHPDAPILGGQSSASPGEWYDRGIVQTTGPDGRLSFRLSDLPGDQACEPGACRGAIWPQGRGDIMEKLGLLAGTPNRHLNGMWLVHEGEIPPPGQPQPQEPPLPPSREQLILLLEKLDRLEALLARLLDK